MNGFEKRALRIKQKIKNTTHDMLTSWDLKQIRIADIAKEAEVSQVTIYNYFGSKEGLLREVFQDYVDLTIEEYEAFLTGNSSLKDKIEYIIFQKKAITKPFTSSLIKQMMAEDPEIGSLIEELYEKKSIPLITDFINKAKEKGEISDKVSVQMVLIYFDLFVQQYEKLLDLVDQSGDPEHFVEEMIHVFFYGICGPVIQK